MNETQLQSVAMAGPSSRRWASNASILIGSCALVATAYWLGMSWLGEPVLGVPAGVWSVAVVFALLRWGEGVVLDRYLSSAPGEGLARWFALAGEALARGARGVADAVLAVPARAEGALSGFAEGWRSMGCPAPRDRSAQTWIRHAERQLCEHESDAPAPGPSRQPATVRSGKPRVGIDAPAHVVQRMLNGTNDARVDWVPIREIGLRPAELCRLRRLDALLQQQERGLVLTGPAGDAGDGSWPDWSEAPTQTTFATLFPLRLEATRVSLGQLTLASAAERDLVATLVEGAVLLAREGRLGMPPAGEREGLVAAMGRLGAAFASAEAGTVHGPAAQAAARVLSSWLCVSERGPSVEDRRELLERCVAAVPGEAETHLRLGAGRIADSDEAGGLSALRRGQVLLGRPARLSADDQLAFLQSELEHGVGDDMAVGRIAAGLTLLRGCLPAEEFAYVGEDLLDDMRFAGWLVGRDPERLMLLRVVRALAGEVEGPTRKTVAA